MPEDLLTADQVDRLGEALAAAEYTVDGVGARLGPVAAAALAREERVPALRATGGLDGDGGNPLETLVRLFLLERPVSGASAARALAPLSLPAAVAAGLVIGDGDRVRAGIDVRPYAAATETGERDYWVASDATPSDRRLRDDHVLGVGGASTTLAQLTLRRPAGTALDLGTGSGVQLLHLAEHVERLVGTDRNPRALAMARLTCALSGLPPAELLAGDLFEPVAGRRFDLVVSNPPFVVSPGGTHLYRDSGLPGDEVCRRIVGQVPDHLAEGGVAQLLANWIHPGDGDWRDRVTGWLPAGCDAWVVQREVSDPAEYAQMWLRDSGDTHAADYPVRYAQWLDGFAGAGIEAVGFGWITLRRTDAEPQVVVEDVAAPVQQPQGPTVARWLDAANWLRAHPLPGLLDARPRVADDVHAERISVATDGSWRDTVTVLVQRDGVRRRTLVDAVLAEVVGRCDGTITLGAAMDATAGAHDLEEIEVLAAALPVVRGLLADGLLATTG